MNEVLMQETKTEDPAVTEQEEAPRKKRFHLPKGKKGRKWMKILVVLVVVAAVVVGCVAQTRKSVNSQLGSSYLVDTVQRRDLTVAVSGTATLEPADSYNVTTLVSGEILSAPFEEGDHVEKDTLLYTLDNSDAQNSMDRANISVEQAQLNYQQALEMHSPTVPISGVISEVYVHNGDTVSSGTALAKVVSSTELTIDFMFPYTAADTFYVGQPASVFVGDFEGSVAGTVVSISDTQVVTSNGMQASSVRVKLTNPGVVSDSFTASASIGGYASYGNASVHMSGVETVYATGSGTVTGFEKLAGSNVTKGEVLCTVDSESIRDQIQNAKLNLETAQLSSQTAADTVDDYNIKSPISGEVIEKNFKAGDKVEGVSSGNLAVIYDLSYLKLEMNVHELDIGKVEVGQKVRITSNAREGEEYIGVVDKISINGTTANGATNYPVTIVIEDYGDLLPGMNVSAQIIGEEVPDVLTVPVEAVDRDGTVLVPGPGAMSEDGTTVADPSKIEKREVTVGRNDDQYIEVTDGLSEGDTILILNQASTLMQTMMGG